MKLALMDFFFFAADLCLIPLGSSQLCSFFVFNALGLSQVVALHPVCVCVCVYDGCESAQLALATDPAMPQSRQPRWTAA